MKRVTILFLGSTGAGPVYSFEMAKALASTRQCLLQCIISKEVSNIDVWKKEFQSSSRVQLDIVQTYKHNKLSYAISLFEFWKVNKIVKIIKRFGPDCLYVPFPQSWNFLIFPRVYRKMKIIATLHDPHPHDISSNLLVNWLSHLNKNAYKYVNSIIILNNKDVQYVEDTFCPNVYVIPHASFSYYVTKKRCDNEIKNTLGFLGRIEPYKGLDLLVDAFLQLNNKYKLLIAGAGKVDDMLFEKIKKNSRIKFINRYIEDNEFSELIGEMDFVVLPYKRASQSGVIPLVFAHGKPVIVTNVGALSEQVPKKTGLVTEPTVSSLVNSIKLMYETPGQIFSFGDNAKRYAEFELSWDCSARKVLSIIHNVSSMNSN